MRPTVCDLVVPSGGPDRYSRPPAVMPTLSSAAPPSPRLARAVAPLARSDRLFAFWRAPVIRLSSPATTVPAAVPTPSSAAPPSPRLVRALTMLVRSDRLFAFWTAPTMRESSPAATVAAMAPTSSRAAPCREDAGVRPVHDEHAGRVLEPGPAALGEGVPGAHGHRAGEAHPADREHIGCAGHIVQAFFELLDFLLGCQGTRCSDHASPL